jgi:hypothetical protein
MCFLCVAHKMPYQNKKLDSVCIESENVELDASHDGQDDVMQLGDDVVEATYPS